MDRSLLDVGRRRACVSQFTLYGDTRRGLRPSFTDAAEPADGRAPVRAVLPRAGRRSGCPSRRAVSARGWRSSWSTKDPVTLLLEA